MNQLDPSVQKWAKWVIILLLARIPKPLQWSSFLSLNPFIRRIVAMNYEQIAKKKQPENVKRHIAKISNIITCCFLYFAVADNARIPKDYLSVYIWISYIGSLNPPSALNIIVSRFSRYTKVNSYSEVFRRLYANKEYVIYPMIFGQILSNYLTPTRYKLNQRYLSSYLKTMILNPIWINFSLGVKRHRINWPGLILIYLQHNAMAYSAFGLMSFKSRFLDRYYELKHRNFLNGEGETSVSDITKNYSIYAGHRANSLINFIYLPNLISMMLISLTSPLLVYLRNPAHPATNKWYLSNVKLFFKSYTKVIGFVAGVVTLYVNSADFIPDYGYKLEASDDTTETTNIRRISKGFIDSLSSYLFRLILLSKWRVVKENHPQFRLLKLKSWNRIEAALMCIGVLKLMNLNDFLARNVQDEHKEQYQKLQEESLPRLINKVM